MFYNDYIRYQRDLNIAFNLINELEQIQVSNIVDLKNILGHKSISTTEIYLQKSERELQETLND